MLLSMIHSKSSFDQQRRCWSMLMISPKLSADRSFHVRHVPLQNSFPPTDNEQWIAAYLAVRSALAVAWRVTGNQLRFIRWIRECAHVANVVCACWACWRTRLADMAPWLWVCSASELHSSVLCRIIHDYCMCEEVAVQRVRVWTSNFLYVNTRCTMLVYSSWSTFDYIRYIKTGARKSGKNMLKRNVKLCWMDVIVLHLFFDFHVLVIVVVIKTY